MTRNSSRLRRSDGLRIVGVPGQFRVYDTFTLKQWDPALLESEALVELLVFCAQWREPADIARFLVCLRDIDEEQACVAIAQLAEVGVLVEESEKNAIRGALLERWAAHGWREPALFHLHTNLLPKLDYALPEASDIDQGLMREYLVAEAAPPNYKRCEGAERIVLSKEIHAADRPIAEVWDVDSVQRSDPLSLEEIGGFCYYAFGQTARKKLPLTGWHVRKTVPSGGSRHPTEVYAISLGPEGTLAPGLYHYDVEHHALDRLVEGDLSEACRAHLFIDERLPSFEPALVFVFTTIFERSMFRYRESRSYRVLSHDLGHLMENASLLAAALDRPCLRAYNLHDSEVERLLGLDLLEEGALAYLAIG